MKKTLDEFIDKKLLKIKKSSSGLGLFTTIDIPKMQKIIEYTGQKLTEKEAQERGGRYLFEINSRYTIDGSGRENTARYLNYSCLPNCEPVIEKGKIIIYAKKKIKSGDELTYDYGKEYYDMYIKPYGCKCIKHLAKKEN